MNKAGHTGPSSSAALKEDSGRVIVYIWPGSQEIVFIHSVIYSLVHR